MGGITGIALTKIDVLIEDFARRGGLVIAEFNTFASPTPEPARARLHPHGGADPDQLGQPGLGRHHLAGRLEVVGDGAELQRHLEIGRDRLRALADAARKGGLEF